ncbi:choice-of-anchor D domain-containing protein [Bacteroidota bacterium]
MVYRKSIIKFAVVLFLCFGGFANAQNILVSEYYNGDSPGEEWTELIVTGVDVSIVNFALRDNRMQGFYPAEWQGGVQFQSSSLWMGLKSGTIIVIRHRGSEAVDVDAEDGYIEIGAENEEYFLKIDNWGTWNELSLNIEADGDIVELLDHTGSHVHSLSHMPNTGGSYTNIQSPKLNYPGTCPEGESISVAPGRNIGNYSGGSTAEWCRASANGDYVTQGKPNKRANYLDDNLKYWQFLRRPEWDEPSLNALVKPDAIELYWNASESGNYQGYLISRVKEAMLSGAEAPMNGTTYKKGDMLGTAIVVVDDPNSLTTSNSDDMTLECNESYVYRIYAYRYSEDDIEGNGISPSNGRGRTYNTEDFASTTVKKPKPAKPIIEIENDEIRFCAGDSLLLTTFVYGGPYSYTWYLNSEVIIGANRKTYYAKQPGWYKVEVTNLKNCSTTSDLVEIIELPSPDARIYLPDREITVDTTFVMCENESFMMNVTGGDRYEWFKDYVKLSNTSSTFEITEEGLFFAVAINDGMECTDTTARIYLDLLHIDYRFDKDTLYYYLDKFTKFGDGHIDISNNSTDTLTFNDIMIPPGGVFSVFAPPPSEIVLPMRSKDYTIRFEPDRSGDFIDSITFLLPCKSAYKRIYLFGYKEGMEVDAEPYTLTFDSLMLCENDTNLKILRINNNESFAIEVRQPQADLPFIIISPAFPITIEGNSFDEITIEFNSDVPQAYSGNLMIPFYANGIRDQLDVTLLGTVLNTSYKIEFYGEPVYELTFPPLIGCDDSAMTAIQVFNTGEVPMEFSQLGEIPGIYINDLPLTIKAGLSKELQILFVPESEGQFNETLYITTEPCGFLDSIKLKGSKNGITFGLSQRRVSFEQVIDCKTPEAVRDTFSLLISGDSQETPHIERVTGPTTNYFTHSIIEGMALSDSNDFYIQFESLPLGEYFDTLRILLMPCEIEKIIPLYGKRINPEITLSSDTLNFGDVEIDTKDTNFITLINSGEVAFTINDVQTLADPFRIITVFPATIEPDSSIQIYFEYAPMQIQQDELLLDLVMTEPCDINTPLLLTGMGREPYEMNVSFTIPDYIRGEPGKDIVIPVYMESIGKRGLDACEISSFDISIRYNPTLLYPKSVTEGDAIGSADVSNLTFDENPPGLTSVHGVVDNFGNVKDGKLFNLKCLALLGNEISTTLLFEAINFNSLIEIIPDTTSGLFKLTGGCALEERLLRLDGEFDLYLATENPVKETGELVISIPSEELTELVFYDIDGNIVKTLMKGNYPPGRYNVNFDILDLGSGTYIVVLRNGSRRKDLKMVVVK